MSIFYRYDKPIVPVTTPGIYHSPSLGLISLSSDGSNWITIADKNLGATQVYNDGDTLSETNCGGFFQRGNNYMFPFTGPTNIDGSYSFIDASAYGPGNYYSSNIFKAPMERWDNPVNYNLWGGTTNTNEARQGPCNSGFHIPSILDINTIRNIFTSLSLNGGDAHNYLKLPYSGYIRWSAYNRVDDGEGYFWTANRYDNNISYLLEINSSIVTLSMSRYVSDGLHIRPFKNTPVQPDSSWTVLYQPS